MIRLLTALTLFLAACAPSSGASTGSDRLSVVATVYPLAWIAQEVLPAADVTALSTRGQDPHDMELTPQQRATVERADIVAYLGDIDFQPQVEAAVEQSGAEIVDVAEIVGRDRLRPLSESDDEEHAGDDEEHAGEDHAEPVDPHVWFDARLMAQVAAAMGDAAARVDAPNAERHRRQGEQVAEDLAALADDIDQMLASCRHDEIVVGHEAYGYLTDPHGLRQSGISGAGGHSEASPADIARLADHVRSRGLPAVLSEPVEGRTDAEAVAAEAGVEVIEILSLDVVDEQQAERGFPALLREQAHAVARAAGCPP